MRVVISYIRGASDMIISYPTIVRFSFLGLLLPADMRNRALNKIIHPLSGIIRFELSIERSKDKRHLTRFFFY